MSREATAQEEMKKKSRPHKRTVKPGAAQTPASEPTRPLGNLQQRVGNRAIQRLLAQRSAVGPAEVDDEIAGRINRKRGSGLPLDSAVQKQMSESTGGDFSQVKVHTDPEADTLNHQLGAKAFTTGQDVFFRAGEYQPQASAGQKLLAHELTHVVQQSQGTSSASGPMKVNAPGDVFEQQADAVANAVTGGQRSAPQSAARVQRAEAPEEEDTLQRQEQEDQDQLQMAPEEEEEQIQRQEDDEEEENMKAGH